MEATGEAIARHVEVISCSESEENVLKSLKSLRALVECITDKSVPLSKLIPPEILFKHLNNSSEHIRICVYLLKKLLNNMKPERIITEYEEAVVQGVNHPVLEVRELCLIQIERCVQTNSGVLSVIQNLDLLNFVIRNLGHPNTACGTIASRILVTVSRHGDGLALLLDSHHQAEFTQLISEGSTISFRVYHLFVMIFRHNPHVFMQVKPVFNRLATEVSSDDVLVQANCLELFTELIIINEQAYQLPQEMGVNEKMYSILICEDENPLRLTLLPAIIKYFGHLSMKNPWYVFNEYPQFFEFVFNCIKANDPLLLIALDTIGVIGSTNEGLNVLFQNEDRRNIMAVIGEQLALAFDEQIKLHCLDTLVTLFNDKTSDKNTSDLIHSLYKKLHCNPMQMLFQVVTVPFNNVRKSCFKLFYILIGYEWMLADIKIMPGFLEYLLDRHTEKDQDCQQLKYDVIKKLSISPYVVETFEKPTVLGLRQYVRDGPFYVASEVSVALDEK